MQKVTAATILFAAFTGFGSLLGVASATPTKAPPTAKAPSAAAAPGANGATERHRGPRAGSAAYVSKFDANHDGKIDEAEFVAAKATSKRPLTADKAQALFERLDKNHDGFLNRDDWKKSVGNLPPNPGPNQAPPVPAVPAANVPAAPQQ